MALLTSEIRRLKYEMGWNLLSAGAEYYIGVAAVFDQVVATYMTSGAQTTSSTVVTASNPPAAAPIAITLASATGVALFDRLIVDVDGRQEGAVVETISGSVVTLLLTKAHTGTYPVTVEGGESIVRDLLRQLYDIGGADGKIAKAVGGAGVKKADEVEFFGGGGGDVTRLGVLTDHREYLRDELWRAIFGQGRAATLAQHEGSGGSGGTFEAY